MTCFCASPLSPAPKRPILRPERRLKCRAVSMMFACRFKRDGGTGARTFQAGAILPATSPGGLGEPAAAGSVAAKSPARPVPAGCPAYRMIPGWWSLPGAGP